MYFFMKNKMNFNKFTYKLIDNNISRKMPVGYCYCSLHQGYINTRLLKQHKCLQKSQKGYCNFLKINKEHPYIKEKLGNKQKCKDKRKLYQKLKKLYYSDKINYKLYKKYNDYINNEIPIEDILTQYK